MPDNRHQGTKTRQQAIHARCHDADDNGQGETVGGVVVMRYGENALQVIQNVKKRLLELQTGLPAGVRIKPVYDRSGLIERAVDTRGWIAADSHIHGTSSRCPSRPTYRYLKCSTCSGMAL